MVTPGELENRNEYISSLSDFMEEAESNFNNILQSCGWERKVIMDQFCYNVFWFGLLFVFGRKFSNNI